MLKMSKANKKIRWLNENKVIVDDIRRKIRLDIYENNYELDDCEEYTLDLLSEDIALDYIYNESDGVALK